jgi:hypothetical protein
MPYTNGDDTYHDRRRCRRLHNTSGRIRRIEDTADRTPCEHCADAHTEGMHERDVAQLVEAGVCPWCDGEDGYEGDYVGSHASSAHPEKWADYKE